MGEQVCPEITSSKQINSAWLNLQVTNPPSSNTSSSSAETFRSSSAETFRSSSAETFRSSSAETFRSSSAVVGVWEEVARGDDEEREVDRKMCSNSCSKRWFSNLNQTNKLACPSLLLTSGFQHPLLLLTPLALQIWATSLLR